MGTDQYQASYTFGVRGGIVLSEETAVGISEYDPIVDTQCLAHVVKIIYRLFHAITTFAGFKVGQASAALVVVDNPRIIARS